MSEIVLVHPLYKIPRKLIAFYDGHIVAENGVARIPYDEDKAVRWAKNIWIKGYVMTPSGQHLSTIPELEAYIERSTKSTDDTESVDGGGLTENQYGIRESQQDSGGDIQESGLGDSDGSGPD